ncbi:MAG: c-type cytochrome [Lewinella sp.]|nr:c-type cytochrome [Lewinella sp.]
MYRAVLIFLCLALVVACGSLPDFSIAEEAPGWRTQRIPPTPQQNDGDAEAGWTYITTGGYVGSGMPYDFYVTKAGVTTDSVLNRPGLNARVPYGVTVFEAPNGVTVANGNCFTCHAGELMGEVVPGLGNSFSDYQANLNLMARGMNIAMLMQYDRQSFEYEAFEDFGRYFRDMSPLIRTNQPGVNPAFRLAEACMRHRDPEDLTYRDTPGWRMSAYTIATDTPPLWHVGKKHALYYTGMGRGDFTKLLFQASVLGIPDSTAARQAIHGFRDVLAWLRQLQPPSYPKNVEKILAEEGKLIFEENCSGCHGTYGETETYPNKLVSLEVIKTDSLYAQYTYQSGIVDWYNGSWFAQTEPRSYFEPSLGYVAPPLDGIWASAPYLHNGSVPTLEDLLNSVQRPTYWQRSGDSIDYDFEKVGWKYESGDRLRGDWVYDTTLPGYSNVGHYFGDKLTNAERRAVVEYLKTL